uniref:Uncharacterized protein n=1 Tax=Plectus sambesii TaxID=2011161 RepID=A0A914XMQ3_9BILA
LNQRIHTVTEERKMLVKRVQHHERNRLKKLLSQQRKSAILTPKIETPPPGPPLAAVKVEVVGS